MTKTRILAILSTLLLCANVHATIRWLTESYDFGTFREAAGPQEGYVQFVNIGPDTTIISRVKPSCGCTAERHTEKLIAPGDTATIWFTYNPKGRPGRFAKTIKIYTGSQNDIKSIPISGTVIGEPLTLEPEFPIVAGNMRLSSNTLDFGKISFGHTAHLFLKAYNQSNDTIFPHTSANKLTHELDVIASSDTIAPGDIFSISFYLNTRAGILPGAYSTTANVWTEPNKQPVEITINAEIEPQSAMLSAAQLEKAPILSLATSSVKTKNKHNKAYFKFPICNKGKSDLEIKRIYCRAPGVKINKVPIKLKSGKESFVEGEIDISQINAPAYAYIIEIISNDPRKPIETIRVSGTANQL